MSHLGIENLEIMLEYVFSLFCRNHAPRPSSFVLGGDLRNPTGSADGRKSYDAFREWNEL